MAQDYNENARKWLEGDFDQETKMKRDRAAEQ